jgi:hypothetical protein
MLFDVYVPVDKDGNVTLSTNAVMSKYKKLVSTVLLSHGQLFIWQARDNERYMHVLCLKKKDVKKSR